MLLKKTFGSPVVDCSDHSFVDVLNHNRPSWLLFRTANLALYAIGSTYFPFIRVQAERFGKAALEEKLHSKTFGINVKSGWSKNIMQQFCKSKDEEWNFEAL